ncbi:hypothetical protein Amsp01_090780 [Amycolatopsis sp. NBRC 101858]|nr:hypothetical protein Amsp01_090780 [Amycolatopsis sp. NBRC 101858]
MGGVRRARALGVAPHRTRRTGTAQRTPRAAHRHRIARCALVPRSAPPTAPLAPRTARRAPCTEPRAPCTAYLAPAPALPAAPLVPRPRTAHLARPPVAPVHWADLSA